MAVGLENSQRTDLKKIIKNSLKLNTSSSTLVHMFKGKFLLRISKIASKC